MTDPEQVDRLSEAASQLPPEERETLLQRIATMARDTPETRTERPAQYHIQPRGREQDLPQRIGPYVVLRALGRGAMGRVLLGWDRQLERLVAIKTLSHEHMSDPKAIARLQREAQLLASLDHPHIGKIDGYEEVDGIPHLVLEFVPGVSLRRRLLDGAMELLPALHIGAQIAWAMDSAHRRGIVHRDIKPENVHLVAEHHVKVLDFGVALCQSRPAAADDGPGQAPDPLAGPRQSRLDVVAGTPGYMAPEVIRSEAADRRADIFSFGCVMYECLSGEPAFFGPTIREILDATLVDEPDYSRLRRDTPTDVKRLLQECLRKTSGERLREASRARSVLSDTAARIEMPAAAAPEGPRETPTNLPADVSSFIGRDRDLERLERLIPDARLISLTGPGGIGKTRLALQAARRVAPRFTDGAWIVELADVGPGASLDRLVAEALGMAPSGSGAADLRPLLAGRRMLLILDNCEHLLEPVVTMVDRLLRANPAVHVLTTSQEPLGTQGEIVYLVRPLGVPGLLEGRGAEELRSYEAVRLFCDRARQVDPDFDLDSSSEAARAIAELCRRLDGVPLEIEMAARRVRVLSVQRMAEYLEKRRLALLHGDDRAAPERQRSIEGAIDHGFARLDEREQLMLESCAVFAGSFTSEAATVVSDLGLDEIDIIDCLEILVRKSLLEAQTPAARECRFRLRESVREFALRRLGAGGREPVCRQRHLEYYSGIANTEIREPGWIGEGVAAPADRLGEELPNVRAALRWWADQGGSEESDDALNTLAAFLAPS